MLLELLRIKVSLSGTNAIHQEPEMVQTKILSYENNSLAQSVHVWQQLTNPTEMLSITKSIF